MNAREKILVVLVGIAAVALVGREVASRYRGTLQEYDNDIRTLNKDLAKIELERGEVAIAMERWYGEIGSQTLSMDVNEATTRLRDELNALAEMSRLQEIAVAPGGRPTSWLKNDLRTLNCSVKAEGKLDDVVRFLYDLHCQPYAVRCKSLTLSQAVKGIRRTRSKGDRDKGLLSMSLQLDTLILPANELVPQIQPAVLEKGQRKLVPRTMLASLQDYRPLLHKELFQPYEPPERPARTTRKPPTPAVRQPQPKREPPPPDAHMVLRGLISSPRGQLTVLEKPGKQPGEDEYKEVGDEMYGGTLIFVHPKGAVTEKDGERRFHAIGQELQDFVPLTEENEPAVYHELLKLESRAAGISQGSR